MRNDLDKGVIRLDNCCDSDFPDDYTAALSRGRRTLQPGETHEFSFALGGVGIGVVDCVPCNTDCDPDGNINAFDIEPFLDLIFDQDLEPCCGTRGDIGGTGDTNGDGLINSFDIEGFLDCLFP